jgi:hypothetical protein
LKNLKSGVDSTRSMTYQLVKVRRAMKVTVRSPNGRQASASTLLLQGMQQAALAQRLLAQVVATLGQRLDQRGQRGEVFSDLAYKLLDTLGDFRDLASYPNDWMDLWGRLSGWRRGLAFEARCHGDFSFAASALLISIDHFRQASCKWR